MRFAIALKSGGRPIGVLGDDLGGIEIAAPGPECSGRQLWMQSDDTSRQAESVWSDEWHDDPELQRPEVQRGDVDCP